MIKIGRGEWWCNAMRRDSQKALMATYGRRGYAVYHLLGMGLVMLGMGLVVGE